MGRTAEPERARTAATEIVRTLRQAGHVAYFAGGCVRDELMGLAPTDYDVATDATPERIKALFKRTDEVGAAFGVVLVTLPAGGGKATVEVATFRSDGPYSDRRRPDVIHFSDPEADARRRDFTINALFLDPLADAPQTSRLGATPAARGKIIDYVGGVADVQARVLRAVGDAEARLAEDHLRALRGVRLAARLGLSIDAPTASAIERRAADLGGVSRERIGDEVRRIMAHPSRGAAALLLTRFGLDAPVLDEAHKGAPPRSILGGLGADAPFAACLAAWALDRGEGPPARDVARRWRAALCLSNEESASLAAILGALAAVREWETLGVAGRKRLAARPGFEPALTLLSLADPAAGQAVRRSVDELASSAGGLDPAPLLDGDMLVAMGMKPGPRFK